MIPIKKSQVTELYAAHDNGTPIMLQKQSEPSPEHSAKRVGFGLAASMENIAKSLPFDRNHIAGLLFDDDRKNFSEIKTAKREDLMQSMENTIFEGNLSRLMGRELIYIDEPEQKFSSDVMDYLDDTAKMDIEILRKLSEKEIEDRALGNTLDR